MTNNDPTWKWWGQSPSSIKTFMTCPLQFKEKYLLKKHPFEATAASLYGDRFHLAAENRIVYGTPEPAEFLAFRPVFDAIVAMNGRKLAEVSLACNAEYNACAYKDYRNKELGAKIDVLVVADDYARIIDWKTGKRYDDPLQIDINALTVFSNFPEVNRIRAQYLYTKSGEGGLRKDYYRDTRYIQSATEEPMGVTRAGVSMILKRMRLAFHEDRFLPNRNGLCKQYCPVTTCHHNGKFSGSH